MSVTLDVLLPYEEIKQGNHGITGETLLFRLDVMKSNEWGKEDTPGTLSIHYRDTKYKKTDGDAEPTRNMLVETVTRAYEFSCETGELVTHSVHRGDFTAAGFRWNRSRTENYPTDGNLSYSKWRTAYRIAHKLRGKLVEDRGNSTDSREQEKLDHLLLSLKEVVAFAEKQFEGELL